MLLNELEFHLMNNPVRRWIQRTVEIGRLRSLSKLGEGKNILEIGCGTGYSTKLIFKHFKPKEITAIDLDPRMVELAQKNNADPRTTFRVADVAHLPFPDATFDAVIGFGVMHHVPDWKGGLGELYRVLRKDGELILEDLSIETFANPIWRKLLQHPYETMYTADQFIQTIKAIGFADVLVRKFNPLSLFPYFILRAVK